MGAWELDLLHALQHLHVPVIDMVMVAASSSAFRLVALATVVLPLLARRRTRTAGVAVIAAVAASELAVPLVKLVFARPRPFMVDASVALIVPEPGGWSFPSGHAASAFAAAGALAVSLGRDRWKLWLPAVLVAALIGFSRLYLFVHWPTDVAVGAVLGFVVGTLAARAVRWAAQHRGHRVPGTRPS